MKKSDEWQDKYSKNRAYELHIRTRIASQRNQYVLLQLALDSKQEEITIKDRYYFFVADRKLHKNLTLLDVLKRPATDSTSNCSNCVSRLVEKANCRCQKQAPKLYIGDKLTGSLMVKG